MQDPQPGRFGAQLNQQSRYQHKPLDKLSERGPSPPRYQPGASSYAMPADPGAEIREHGIDKNVLPRQSDPKLWCVKCFGGEQEVLNCLNVKLYLEWKKALTAGHSKYVAPIYSAFCSELIKGYVYIEAFKEQELRSFLMGVRLISAASTKLVPEEEMVKVLQMGVQSVKASEEKIKSGRT